MKTDEIAILELCIFDRKHGIESIAYGALQSTNYKLEAECEWSFYSRMSEYMLHRRMLIWP